MAVEDTQPAPPHALTMWLTDHDIIAMLPMTKGGPCYLMRFALSEGGLMQALEVLKKRKREVLTPLEALDTFDPPRHQPQVKLSKAQERLRSETTESQRENARKVLAKLGMK